MSDDRELLRSAMDGQKDACDEVGRKILRAAIKSAQAIQFSATELVISDVTFKWTKIIAEKTAKNVQNIEFYTQTMVWNYYRNWIRKQKSERAKAVSMSSLDTSTQRFVDIYEEESDDWPGARLEAAERNEIVEKWRKKLSERDARIVCLKEEGMDLSAIAVELRMTTNAVTIVISRTKAALAEMLGIRGR